MIVFDNGSIGVPLLFLKRFGLHLSSSSFGLLGRKRNAQIFNNSFCSLQQLHDLTLLRLCWWIKGWEDWFPYSSDEVLRHPQCLKMVSRFTPQINKRPFSDLGTPPHVKVSNGMSMPVLIPFAAEVPLAGY